MEKIISLQEFPSVPLLFGSYNRNLKLMSEAFGVKIIARDNIKVYGDEEDVEKTSKVVGAIKEHIQRRGKISSLDVEQIIAGIEHRGKVDREEVPNRFNVQPRTAGQKEYMQAMSKYEIVFAIGPAGTGKTYLAVAMALDALKRGRVRKIVLVRPAVEAGEKLGFLPGDYQAKINPYLRPLYDSLHDLIGYDRLKRYLEKDIVEIAPLAYMRGRTLESAFIILDEAQNTTETQMKMFLTRLGLHSRIVITGDITQIDLGRDARSGLVQAQSVLQDVKDISICKLTKKDIVRHHLVARIVAAYEKHNEKTS